MVGAVSCLAAAPAGPGEPCLLHEEGFESFAGPRDVTDGPITLRWCLSGASVASSSFCPTGNALRLDSATDDPIVWVDLGGASCSSVTLEFTYSQFAATGSVLRSLASGDATLNCARPVSAAAVALDAVGGTCTAASHTVDVRGGTRSIYWKIDHGSPGSPAIFIDDVRILLAGCCDVSHDCCETGDAGCSDAEVRDCVCAVDPYCCEFEWDEQCVVEVTALGCGTCGGEGGCGAGFAADFGSFYQTGSVCSRFPELFESCTGSGPYLTTSLACAGPGDAAMRFGTGFPYSAAVTRCLDLAAIADPALRLRYSKFDASLGPRVDLSIAGGEFTTLWTAPFSPGAGCHEVVLPLAAYTGEAEVRLRMVSGSSVDNGASIDDLELIERPPPGHSCCEPGAPGCDDLALRACVCAVDPYCCEVEWDSICVISVEYYECGDCGLCIESFASDFGGADAGAACAAWPGLFILCEGEAPIVSTDAPCGGQSDAALQFGGSQAGMPSAAITSCIDLRGVDSAAWRLAWSPAPGGDGPLVEVSLDAGGVFATIWAAPRGGAGCRSACIDLGAYLELPFVLFRFSGPAGAAIDDLVLATGEGCPAPDLNGDAAVDVADLLILLGAWGPCRAPCAPDLDGTGAVDVADLLMLLAAWG
jgi:hypothetical protein